jgi:hypothetical protein
LNIVFPNSGKVTRICNLGFQSEALENTILLGYCPLSLGVRCPVFPDCDGLIFIRSQTLEDEYNIWASNIEQQTPVIKQNIPKEQFLTGFMDT